jgi:hypothetical protein
LNTPQPCNIEYPSKRKKKIAIRKSYRQLRSHIFLRYNKKPSKKIRELVSPKLFGKHEIIILIKREQEVNDKEIIETLRNLIPGQFKAIYCRDKYCVYLNKIYLKKESDLFAVQMFFQQHIYRIMRIVKEK